MICASLMALICSRALAALGKGLNATSLHILPKRSMSLLGRENTRVQDGVGMTRVAHGSNGWSGACMEH